GIMSSLRTNLIMSAKGCKRPQGPTRFGPSRFCTHAAIFRSRKIRYEHTVRMANKTQAIVRIVVQISKFAIMLNQLFGRFQGKAVFSEPTIPHRSEIGNGLRHLRPQTVRVDEFGALQKVQKHPPIGIQMLRWFNSPPDRLRQSSVIDECAVLLRK